MTEVLLQPLEMNQERVDFEVQNCDKFWRDFHHHHAQKRADSLAFFFLLRFASAVLRCVVEGMKKTCSQKN